MTLSTFAFIFAGVMLNATAQLLLKAGTRALGALNLDAASLPGTVLNVSMQPYILGGTACYVISMGIWIVALSRVDVSIAYPMLSMGYVVNAILAWQLFGEALTTGKLTGIGIILIGVLVLVRS